jgi:hypothetical protein
LYSYIKSQLEGAGGSLVNFLMSMALLSTPKLAPHTLTYYFFMIISMRPAQVRLSTGSRLVVRLNHHHTVRDLKQEIRARQPPEVSSVYVH